MHRNRQRPWKKALQRTERPSARWSRFTESATWGLICTEQNPASQIGRIGRNLSVDDCWKRDGAASRARTSDLVIFSHALSQLSYGGLGFPYPAFPIINLLIERGGPTAPPRQPLRARRKSLPGAAARPRHPAQESRLPSALARDPLGRWPRRRRSCHRRP